MTKTHTVNIAFEFGRTKGVKTLKGASCYNEARAWLNARLAELKHQGYTVRCFTISSLTA